MVQFQPEGMERVNSCTDSYIKIMIRGIAWKEIEADTSKISQDLREIQKTIQDYGHRLSNIPMKVDYLCHKMDEILKILPYLHKNLTDLKIEIADLKRNQRENPETSISRQEHIRDALGTLIDEWVVAIKIAATNLELDKENFIKLVELSLEGSVKIGWDNTPADTKASIIARDSKSAIADRLGRRIKIHFIGDGYFEGSSVEKAREYAPALFGLELRSICAIDECIYWFHKYFFQSGENQVSQEKGRSKVITHTLGIPEEPLSSEDHSGPKQKPEYTNLDKGADQQGLHPKDLDEQIQDPHEEPLREELSDGPILGPMKVSKTATAGHVEQRGHYPQTARRNLNDSVKQNHGKNHASRFQPQSYDGFRIGGIGKVLNQIGLNQRKHHIIYKVSSGEFAIPMEFTGNVMEMQLIPKEEILEELRKLMFDIHPRIAYNLADQDFSRVLTLHQNFKRKDLMKEGNRPYSITYRIPYALFNTHHSDLFLRKEYIEIPRIFKEFAKVMAPDPIRIPRIVKPGVFPKEARKTLPVIAGRDFSQKILILNRGIREAKIMIGGALERPSLGKRGDFDAKLTHPKTLDKRKFGKVLLSFRQQGLIDSDSFYEESEEEIRNLKEALQELKTMDINEESKLSLENVKRLIQRNFSENPLAWWDRNKIEATLKIKEECKYEYVRYKPIQMNMEDKNDMQMIIKKHINLGLIEPGISA
ncbi:movement protein [Sesamum angolense]|uniref:Movement protein n=1 Tax=Sesamum angolense TaxID=2727404 RepID=A0AAE1WAH7_9LAMI|nr:movement protein [Sesamum angolense]